MPRLGSAGALVFLCLSGCGAFLPPTVVRHNSVPARQVIHVVSPPCLGSSQVILSSSVSGGGFQSKKGGRRKKGSGAKGTRKTSSGGGDRPQRWLEEDSESAPDGEEEVIELNMPVEELVDFSERLESGFKALSKKHEDSEPMVVLNATGLHWILSQVSLPRCRMLVITLAFFARPISCYLNVPLMFGACRILDKLIYMTSEQVAYDTGIRMIGVAGLNQIREASRWLPDDIQ